MKLILFLLAAVLCLLGAQAVIIVTGDGTGNTSAPSDDFGWDYVGEMSIGGVGIYLGGFNRNGEYQHWVLTAAHGLDGSSLGTLDLGGVTYNIVSNSNVSIKNPDGHGIETLTETYADLAVIRLQSGPTNMPNFAISQTSPPVGSSVVAVGSGWDRETTWTAWDINWNEVALNSLNAYDFGYKWLSTGTKRWGNNIIDSNSFIWANHTKTLEFDFDDPYSTIDSGVAHEAMVVPGDSGGGVVLEKHKQHVLGTGRYSHGVCWCHRPTRI